MQFTNNTAWFSMNVATIHPYASSLNVNGINGISIRSRTSSVSDPGSQVAQITWETIKGQPGLTFNVGNGTINLKNSDGNWTGINYDFMVKAAPGYADFKLVVKNGLIVGGDPIQDKKKEKTN